MSHAVNPEFADSISRACVQERSPHLIVTVHESTRNSLRMVVTRSHVATPRIAPRDYNPRVAYLGHGCVPVQEPRNASQSSKRYRFLLSRESPANVIEPLLQTAQILAAFTPG